MAIVSTSIMKRVCATCAYWQGPREFLGEEISFNNRDCGICGGPSFKGWRMSAISNCTFWQLRREPGTPDAGSDFQPVTDTAP